MTIQHILYLPTIFVFGLVFGIMFNEKRRGIIADDSLVSSRQDDPVQRRTSGSKLFQFFIIFLLVFVVTHMFEIPWGSKAVSQLLGEVEIFDKRPVFSSIEVYKRISQFPVEGLTAYKQFTYTIDIIFPLSFFAFLITLARFVSQRITIPKYLENFLIGLPFFWFASDLIENAVIFSLLFNYPSQSIFLASSLGYITAMKFGLLLFSIFTPSLLIIFARKYTRQLKRGTSTILSASAELPPTQIGTAPANIPGRVLIKCQDPHPPRDSPIT